MLSGEGSVCIDCVSVNTVYMHMYLRASIRVTNLSALILVADQTSRAIP